jgi:hypothetical protein
MMPGGHDTLRMSRNAINDDAISRTDIVHSSTDTLYRA